MPEQPVSLTIDDKEVTVPKGTLIIRAAEQLGIEVPRFCDHPYLAPAGACRQCYVQVEGQGKLLEAQRLGEGRRVVGIDLDDPALHAEWAKRTAPNLEYRVMEASDLPFADDEFDRFIDAVGEITTGILAGGDPASVLELVAARARELCERAAWISGHAHQVDSGSLGARDLLAVPSAAGAASAAGAGPVELAELHAPFTHQELILRRELGIDVEAEAPRLTTVDEPNQP